METVHTLALSLEAELEIENDQHIASVDQDYTLSAAHSGSRSPPRKPMNSNRLLSFDADLPPPQLSSVEPFVPAREPERSRYLASDGRNFLRKPKGWLTRRIRANISDSPFSTVDTKTSTPYPSTLSMEEEKPHKCEVCCKRYKKLEGLEYHKQHSPPCNRDLRLSKNITTAGLGGLDAYVSLPATTGESSSTLHRGNSPPPSPLRSPGFDGDFDGYGEIPFKPGAYSSPQQEPVVPSYRRPRKRISFARSLGSETDDDDLLSSAPHQIPVTPGYIQSRQRSRSRPRDRVRSKVRESGRDRYRILPRERDRSLPRERSRDRYARHGQIINPDDNDQSELLFRRPSGLHRMRSCDVIPGPQRALQGSADENDPISQSKTDSSSRRYPISSDSVDVNSYKYESLDSSANQIRLIKLEPKNGTMVTASLFITLLDDAPIYEALSYTWGNSRKRSLIHLDNAPFQVTQNLGTALEKLQGTETRTLWIDAICINQKDDNERSDQVTKMRTIYAQASTVVVWLGDHSQHSALAFSLLKEMDAKLDDKPSIEEILNSTGNLNALQGLSKILSREYWWRIWVIQEVHFAPKVLVHCGDSSITWENIIRIQEKLSTEFGGILHHLSSFYPSLRNLSTAINFRGPSSLIVSRSYPSNPQSPATVPSLFEALLMHRLKHSTDPRDKIYALVGLTTARSDPDFQIDYSYSVRKLYIDTASYILKDSHTLDFLCAKTKGDEFPNTLPSWCPNWASTGAKCPIPFRHATSAGVYSASQTRSPIADIGTSTGILSAKGIFVRTVENASPPCGMRSIDDSQNALQTLHVWFQFVDLEVESSNEVHKRFVKLVLGADDEEEIIPLIEYLVKYRELMDYWVVPPPLPKEIDRVGQVFAQKFFQRSLFVTEEGEFGLTEKGVREGDAICILFGCSLPVVLRRDGGEMERGYEFVGDALLQGWMFGRGIEELEQGFYCEETFILGD